jgi:uncharacterized protein YcaQ
MRTTLSLAEARRVAIASQGFGAPRPANPSVAHLKKLASQINAFQIDSVNVLVRAHYMPAFARLGTYPTDALDALVYRTHDLFEYWGHAACFLPISLYPLLRYRMQSDLAHEYLAAEPDGYIARAYAEIAERGALAAGDLSEPGKRSGPWWGWASGKIAMEYLYDRGLVAIAGRRGFERLYDLAERVIPPSALEVSIPREAAMKELICLGAKACGVGTAVDITGYLKVDGWHDRLAPGPPWREERIKPGRTRTIARRLLTELVEEGRLAPVRVEGWPEQAYLHPEARVPRSVNARALVTPFDSLVWERSRIDRLFGMKYSIELYTPPPKRIYGYYVCPFLLGDTLVGRCDLKADRQRKTLMVLGAFLEPGREAPTVAPDLMEQLHEMQAWLQLDRIDVVDNGDLAPALRNG